MFPLDHLEATDFASNMNSQAVRIFVRGNKPGVTDRHLRSRSRKLTKTAGLLDVFAVKEGFRPEALHLARICFSLCFLV